MADDDQPLEPGDAESDRLHAELRQQEELRQHYQRLTMSCQRCGVRFAGDDLVVYDPERNGTVHAGPCPGDLGQPS